MKLELGLYQAAPVGGTEAYQKPRKKQMTEKQKRKKLLQYKFPLRKRLALDFGSNKYTLRDNVAEMTNNGVTKRIILKPNGKILETLLTCKYSMLSSEGWGRIECQRIEQYDGTGKLIRKFYSIPQKRMVRFETRDYPYKQIYTANANLVSVLKDGPGMLERSKENYWEKYTIDELCEGTKWLSVTPHKNGTRRNSIWEQKGNKYSLY